MKLHISLNKKLLNYQIKIDKKIYINFNIKNKYNNISLKAYNYMLIIKLLRSLGSVKPLLNRKDFK